MRWHGPGGALCASGLVAALWLVAACPRGPACRADEDCDADRVCATDEETGLAVCARPCAADYACPAGYACVERDDGSFEGACLDVSGTLDLGESCGGDRECRSGSCAGAGGASCVEPCTDDLTCDDEATRCILDGIRRVCVAPLDELPAGEACTDPRECASGTCVDPPDPHAGEPAPPVCADNCSEAVDCPRDDDACVRLRGGARACLLPLADGAECQSAEACAGGYCLEDLDGALKCASACIDNECAEAFACVDDSDGNRVCMPRLDERAAGEPCTSARECASGHCAHFATETEEYGTLCADPCGEDDSCSGGLVCWTDDEDGTDVCGPVPDA